MGIISRTSPVATRLWFPVQKLTDRRILLIVGGAFALLGLLLWLSKSLRNRVQTQKAETLFKEGLREKSIGDPNAILRFQEALGYQPDPSFRLRIYLQLADSCCQFNKQDEGIWFLKTRLNQTTDPNHRAMIQGAEAIILSSQSRHTQASLNLFREAITTAKDVNLRAHLQLEFGKVLENNDIDSAMKVYHEGLLAPVSDLHLVARLHYCKGQLWQKKDDLKNAHFHYQTALIAFRQAKNRDPNVGAKICFSLFSCEQIEKESEDLSLLNEGIDWKPTDRAVVSKLYFFRGIKYFVQEKYEDAARDFQNVLKANPPNINLLTETHSRLGECYRQLGKLDQALVTINAGLKLPLTSSLTPHGQEFRFFLYRIKATIHYAQSEDKEAYDTCTAGLQEAQTINPPDRSWQAFFLGSRAAASPKPLDDLHQAWALLVSPPIDKNDDDSRTHIALSISIRSSKDEALPFLQTALTFIDDPDQKSIIEKRITLLSG